MISRFYITTHAREIKTKKKKKTKQEQKKVDENYSCESKFITPFITLFIVYALKIILYIVFSASFAVHRLKVR